MRGSVHFKEVRSIAHLFFYYLIKKKKPKAAKKGGDCYNPVDSARFFSPYFGKS